jgi:hypothetical protein
MADPSMDALRQFDDPSKWVIRDNVPIFDEHDEFDKDGKLVRRFDRQALEIIAQNNNRREATTGDLCPIAIGHTVRGAPESSQPKISGFARKFRVGHFGPQKKLAILSTFYFKPELYGESMTYPRRSIELWPGPKKEDWIADPVSLLRKTPQRDLGLLLDDGSQQSSTPYYSAASTPVAYMKRWHGRTRLVYSRDDDELFGAMAICNAVRSELISVTRGRELLAAL